MKRILSILLLAFCAHANAVIDHYAWNNIAFPDETSTNGLPEAIPCIKKKAFDGQPLIKCTWLETSREVLIWDTQRQQDLRYVNQVSGTCLRGRCRTNTTIVGEWKQDVFFSLSIWYRIGVSTDGKPVAYRVDTSRQVSYAEAGSLLYQFYLDIGVPDNQLVPTFDGRYEGGYAAWQAQKGSAPASTLQSPTSAQSEWPDVKSAWCNPRMDDDCYINNQKVPVAELGKWLPSVSESNVDQLGGYCETILCFDSKDQPLGYLLQ
ncbi:hypothetical protein EGJ65_00825 [Pseudomonas aeruginosa]|uniref:hypothetical protein n=1 Tax=Pseudomonas aeruginosa TaxID=287 RepID=UPI000F737AF2|nr:hypothetical protein [Pseudomonas aeruginosa]MBG6573943.1 hypothetical protein [Pseudomonas aeruginosa]MBH9370862.1 hypothetical protein [Pseudomonas aeruginosa]MCO1772291.1 hypothetical protein [Pseudomonas aeruginosa]MCV0081513.1 hypothetical protein [Pseudomonas aeruginosa]MDQ9116324.1 hypothetical protein [Pseudomonas aeruginosa]